MRRISNLHAGQGRGFGGVVSLELSVKTEAGAVGGAQNLVDVLAGYSLFEKELLDHSQFRKSPC
jgi:hypothetical protein